MAFALALDCVWQFLPKFDNQDEGAMLTSDPACAVEARCLAVTKKHSGHLVMAPPFYSKNGCANRFSRMGELLRRAAAADALWRGVPRSRRACPASCSGHGACGHSVGKCACAYVARTVDGSELRALRVPSLDALHLSLGVGRRGCTRRRVSATLGTFVHAVVLRRRLYLHFSYVSS